MNNLLETQREHLLIQLTQSIPQFKAAGFGQVMDLDSPELKQVDVDLSVYSFIEEGAKAVASDSHYFVLSSNNVLLYIGYIDTVDKEDTITKDMKSFPHLIETSILLGKEDIKAVTERFSEPMYVMNYCTEAMGGMVKAHQNGHIDLEAELAKQTLS